MFVRSIRTLLFLVLLSVPQSASAGLKSVETAHLRLIYFDGIHSFIAPHVVRCFENAYRYHADHWGGELPGKVNVFLHDMTDQGNAGARNIPSNLIISSIAPFHYAYETMPANERMNTIMNHEMVHIHAMDRSAPNDRVFRTLFLGKPEPVADAPLSIVYDYLTSPRRSAPRWYHEGIAVFLETWMAGGYGRAMGPYDEMVFRTMVRDSARFYDPVGVESEGTRIDFHVGVNSYLYGARFMSYLALEYGPQRVMEWVNRDSGSRASYASQFEHAFGQSLDDGWREWIEWENTFQRANLARVREYPVTPARDITDHSLGAVSRAYYDVGRRTIYAAVGYPGRLAFLAAISIDDGRVRELCDVKNPALFYVSSVAFDSTSGTLYYTTDHYGWRDLRSVDIATGRSNMLLKDARIGDLAYNHADSSLWGVRHFNGLSTIVRMPRPHAHWEAVRVWPYGKDVYDLDVSRDGQWLSASLAEVSGRQALIRMSIPALLADDTAYTELHDFGNTIPQGFVFSEDGRYLTGSSYYTGVSNIFRYDIAADSMEALSNCETGFFRPIEFSSDSLIVFRYSPRGFVPAIIAATPLSDINATEYLGQAIVETHPVVKEWIAGSPGRVDYDEVVTREGAYHPLTSWHISSLYPVVEGYKSTTAPGLRLNLSDRLGLQEAHVTASYSTETNLPEDQRWHVHSEYSYSNVDLSFSYNHADFYDLFGPTRTSRKGYSAEALYTRNLLFDEPRAMDLELSAGYHGNLERLPDYQNVAASFDEFGTGAIELNYENVTASLGAVDIEKGQRWRIGLYSTFAADNAHPQGIAGFDYGAPLPIAHSSVWAWTSAGFSHGDRDEPLDNFYFGGFGNNWVDHHSIKRFREWYSLPGLTINQLAGTSFAKATLEWSLPPLRFRRLGFPALYASWLRTALFATGLATNIDDSDLSRSAGSIGAQCDVRLQLLSQLRLTFSTGYAVAAPRHRRATDEWMFSLKVL
jgi:hypothetical protein